MDEMDDLDLWIKIAVPYRNPDGKIREEYISDRDFFTLRNTHIAKSHMIHQFKFQFVIQDLYRVALHPNRLEWIF